MLPGAALEKFGELFRPTLEGEIALTSSVQRLREGGEWTVVIVEDDAEVRNTFTLKEHAANYAEGQRLRLKLPPLHMDIPPPRQFG